MKVTAIKGGKIVYCQKYKDYKKAYVKFYNLCDGIEPVWHFDSNTIVKKIVATKEDYCVTLDR